MLESQKFTLLQWQHPGSSPWTSIPEPRPLQWRRLWRSVSRQLALCQAPQAAEVWASYVGLYCFPVSILAAHLSLLLTSVCLALEVSLSLLILLFSICWQLGNQATRLVGTVCRWGPDLPELVPRGPLGTGFVPTFWLLTARLSGLRFPDGTFRMGGTSLHFLSVQGWVLAWGRPGGTVSCGCVTWPRCSWHHDVVLESEEFPPWQLWPRSCWGGSRGEGGECAPCAS